jgi:DnaA-homolog protein
MRQMPLNLAPPAPQTLESFAIGQNAELLHLLRAYAAPSVQPPSERFVYLWGESGAGKTHLLRALATVPRSRYLAPGDGPGRFDYEREKALYLIDDCHKLGADEQIAAFNLFNQVRENGGLLVTAGDSAPAQLRLREDLRTRLGWGLIYQVHGLTDEEKISALQQLAAARGLTVSASVLPYLITHFRRDMRSLSAMLDALDQYSLETQRPVTLPLLRELLQQEHLPEQE